MKKILYLFLLFTVTVLLFSCSKNRSSGQLYNGTVVGIQDGCVLPPAQYPYIIKFDDVTELDEKHPIRIIPGLDSSCMGLIPDEYKIIGKKIKFGFRNADTEFTCNGNTLIYSQVTITEISSNQ